VLWDIDHTLVSICRVGHDIYDLAFTEMFGRPMPDISAVSMAGRTERAIALDVLTVAGVPDPRAQIDAFQQIQAVRAASLASRVREFGRVLPGVPEALAAVAAGRPGLRVVQSLLTGNLLEMAEVKLGALGLLDDGSPLDLEAGAYGTESEIRADLVPVARRNAAARYDAQSGGHDSGGTGSGGTEISGMDFSGMDFSGTATVLVGDTPLDIEAALNTGARAVGVATGRYSVAELAASGAHAVLPDLADTAQVTAAILG
jgi:phosphoglycolate phosphatase-like HAD superfamily hydrolase